MTITHRLRPALPISVLAGLLAAALPHGALADVPDWLQGRFATNARLTAPDGAQLRIRCTLEAQASGADQWTGTLGCATVQGRFQGQWNVALAGGGTVGQIVFSGIETAQLDLSGTADDSRVALSSPDGQGAIFTPGPDGAMVVEMQALGPQRLTGALTFEAR